MQTFTNSRCGCAADHNSGTCSNRKTIKRDDVQTRVLFGLKDKLLHLNLVAGFIAQFQRESRKERLQTLAARTDAERNIARALR